MKKITHIGMAAIVAMGMLGTSCNKVESQEMETPETHKDNIVTLTTTVGFGEADTKALDINYTDKKLTKTFAAGEQVVLTYEDQDGNNQNTVSQALTDEDISADGKSAKLTFTLTNPKADGSITYKYPASMFEDNGHVKTSYFFAQNGTLTDVATRDYAEYDGSFAGTNLPASATLDNEIAVVAFTLYKSDGTTDITNTITGMTIEVGGVTYTITPSGLDKIYVAMWPEGGSEIITITATDGTKNYTKTLTSKTYEAGQFYQQGLKMVAAKKLDGATAEDKGKIVGQDGNIYDTKDAAEAAGTQAVAMIAYVGNGEGLALALTDEGGMTWSTAKSTCEGKTAVSGAVWLLPSQEQWKAMFKANGGNEAKCDGLNAALATAGDELTKTASYWSSTPYDGNRAWLVRLVDAIWSYDDMDYSFRVRACLSFTATRVLAEATAEDKGKVVCAAGHLHTAKTAVPAGCTAVGILGKVTETGHGLILALQDATAQTWNTINGWTTVTAYAGTTLKQLPAGALGSLTSYTTLGSTAVSNWCVAQKSDYKAIFVNLGSTTGDSEGKTYDGNVNAYITTGVGGTAISGSYWSATEGDYTIAWYFASIYWYYSNKKYSSSVRPVLGF